MSAGHLFYVERKNDSRVSETDDNGEKSYRRKHFKNNADLCGSHDSGESASAGIQYRGYHGGGAGSWERKRWRRWVPPTR